MRCAPEPEASTTVLSACFSKSATTPLPTSRCASEALERHLNTDIEDNADDFQTAPTETGMVYALVTHVPGPLGSNEVDSFTSNRSAGYVAAVQAFSDPGFAATVANVPQLTIKPPNRARIACFRTFRGRHPHGGKL